MSLRSTLSPRAKLAVLAASAVFAVGVLLALGPIAQDQGYHAFADTRRMFGIANFANVASNAVFLLIGAWGLVYVCGVTPRERLWCAGDHWPYLVFFAGGLLVAFGSAYYHLRPDDARLVWDRLPMTVAFMGFFAAFITDRIDARIGVRVALPLLVAAGIGSVIYWAVGAAAGHGDLRPYALVQFYPALAIPLMCWLYPGRRTDGRYFVWALFWSVASKLAEHFDAALFQLLGETVSGHTIKHLLASGSICAILAMLRHTANRDASK